VACLPRFDSPSPPPPVVIWYLVSGHKTSARRVRCGRLCDMGKDKMSTVGATRKKGRDGEAGGDASAKKKQKHAHKPAGIKGAVGKPAASKPSAASKPPASK